MIPLTIPLNCPSCPLLFFHFFFYSVPSYSIFVPQLEDINQINHSYLIPFHVVHPIHQFNHFIPACLRRKADLQARTGAAPLGAGPPLLTEREQPTPLRQAWELASHRESATPQEVVRDRPSSCDSPTTMTYLCGRSPRTSRGQVV